ncbi:hypothetical protein C0W42_22455 [Photobacterium kishitanii]|uniref:hypothetical protein n=1 Tax=Photobacterium kishitanii TaxID=318456 RepID=UPI000D17BECB|nr:hypothetical protein [Photobacterium kishitanii]PSU83544.1 hypothetical protein C0W42_22455 [Photobacterium kishitanii]
MLNLDLNPEHIEAVISGIDFADSRNYHEVKISESLTAQVHIVSNELKFNLLVDGWWASTAAQLVYWHHTRNNKTELKFKEINSSRCGTNQPVKDKCPMETNIYAYKNKASAYIALTLICRCLEDHRDMIESKLYERQTKMKQTQSKIAQQAKVQKEECTAKHQQAVMEFEQRYDVINNEKQANKALSKLKKIVGGSQSLEFKSLFIKSGETEVSTYKFTIARLGISTLFYNNLNKRITQADLAGVLVNKAIIEIEA